MLTSKQLPTVTVCLVLISHKEVLHETLESLLLSSSTAKFVNLRTQAPIFVTGKERKLETKGKDCNKQQKLVKMHKINELLL